MITQQYSLELTLEFDEETKKLIYQDTDVTHSSTELNGKTIDEPEWIEESFSVHKLFNKPEFIYILVIKEKEDDLFYEVFSTEQKALDYVNKYLKGNFTKYEATNYGTTYIGNYISRIYGVNMLPLELKLPFCILKKKIDEWDK